MLEDDQCDGKKTKQGKGNVGCWHVERVTILDSMISGSLGITFLLFYLIRRQRGPPALYQVNLHQGLCEHPLAPGGALEWTLIFTWMVLPHTWLWQRRLSLLCPKYFFYHCCRNVSIKVSVTFFSQIQNQVDLQVPWPARGPKVTQRECVC